MWHTIPRFLFFSPGQHSSSECVSPHHSAPHGGDALHSLMISTVNIAKNLCKCPLVPPPSSPITSTFLLNHNDYLSIVRRLKAKQDMSVTPARARLPPHPPPLDLTPLTHRQSFLVSREPDKPPLRLSGPSFTFRPMERDNGKAVLQASAAD